MKDRKFNFLGVFYKTHIKLKINWCILFQKISSQKVIFVLHSVYPFEFKIIGVKFFIFLYFN